MAAFEKYDAEHQKLWDTMKIIRDATALNNMAQKVIAHKAVYQAVERDTGVPWQMVAVIHVREAGLQDVGVWARGIHNGQSWKRKATIKPYIGPFSSWHECAVYSLKLKGFDQVKNWTPAKMLSGLEPYNGYGYRNKGMLSPYLWASTNHQQRGKYVSDGNFNPSVMDTQLGCAAMLKFLGVGKSIIPPVVRDTTGVLTTTLTFGVIFQEYILPIAIFGAIALGTVWMYRYFNRNKS